jgi:dethiobiotin synthetase
VRGIFVTGTDTACGKSVLAAAVCAGLAARDERVAAFKPVVTGLDEGPGLHLVGPAGDSGGGWPADHVLLASAANAGQAPADVAPYRFGPAVSPHLAEELADMAIDPQALAAHARSAAGAADALVCEGVGGLMVPLTTDFLVRDLASELELPLVVAARPGLGTISHTLLTLEAARSSGLDVLAVVLTPWPEEPDVVEHSNRATISRLGRVSVCGLPETRPDRLAEAAEALPLDEWL